MRGTVHASSRIYYWPDDSLRDWPTHRSGYDEWAFLGHFIPVRGSYLTGAFSVQKSADYVRIGFDRDLIQARAHIHNGDFDNMCTFDPNSWPQVSYDQMDNLLVWLKEHYHLKLMLDPNMSPLLRQFCIDQNIETIADHHNLINRSFDTIIHFADQGYEIA